MSDLNLFGDKIKKIQKVKVFCDESKAGDWIYIGLLIVPEEHEQFLLNILLNQRCGRKDNKPKNWLGCENLNKCKFHESNNKEFHYSNLSRNKDMYFLGERWVSLLLTDSVYTRFHVLGIDISKLNLDVFESKSGNTDSIYNRFFRSAVNYAVKSLLKGTDKIQITGIYHDNNPSVEGHKYFPWHVATKLNEENNILCSFEHIVFLDSNHSKSQSAYSNFIQYIDLILGCVKETLEAESPSESNDKQKIVAKALPFVERVITEPYNRNSQYKYLGRCSISFFPKEKIEKLEELYGDKAKFVNNFYKTRPIKFAQKKQMSLFDQNSVGGMQ